MPRCDDCGDDVREVWRFSERTESMTHRKLRWTCRECNPDVDQPLETITSTAGGTRSETERQQSD